MNIKRVLLSIFAAALLFLTGAAYAQTYSFSLDQETVHVFWQEDGTMSLNYEFVFSNDSFASPIDYVDVGLPTKKYSLNNITASVNNIPITHVANSAYVEGIELGLGSNSIPGGSSGVVQVQIDGIRDVLYPDDTNDGYVSGVFTPTWFDSDLVHGKTDLTVVFHLPPNVAPNEPRWHKSPPGWQDEPITGFDDLDRIVYVWHNPNANAHSRFKFGASFPQQYVPTSSIVRQSFLESLGIAPEDLIGFTVCLGFLGFFIALIYFSALSANRRKLKYLPPKLSIAGHGIKRGLTAIEASILFEQPMDKILTMILFALIKKNAATVTKQNPLTIKVSDPIPLNLRPYESDFLTAFAEDDRAKRKKILQKSMVSLIKSVTQKMRGFSRKETITYYRDIMERAWAQVEAADTPEVRSEKYDEVMEWTMLDKNYGDRTRDVFQHQPVYTPTWWPRYHPTAPTRTPRAASLPKVSSSGKGSSIPHLPGSDFAASIVNGVQNFSAGVIGDLTSFTGGVTKTTNPPPAPTTTSYSGGGRSSGGSSCACACACAGCACACAGGGR